VQSFVWNKENGKSKMLSEGLVALNMQDTEWATLEREMQMRFTCLALSYLWL
jgi:hypothetical protein